MDEETEDAEARAERQTMVTNVVDTHRGDPACGGTPIRPTEWPGPPPVLLAGEEDSGDEPHIQRGID